MPRVIAPREFGKPLGMYSHGMAAPAGEIVVVAGQVGARRAGEVAGPDVESQTKQAFENVRAVVEAAGCSMKDVVRLQTFLTSADDIGGFMKARQEVFASGTACTHPTRCWWSAAWCAPSSESRSRRWPCARAPSLGARRSPGDGHGASPT